MFMKLILIDIETNNPTDNLQLEEDIFRSRVLPEPKQTDLIIRFWRNNPCIVMGRFQKREHEINEEYINKHKLPVLRRFTGGGTVYHDKGTLNFTLIKNREHMFHSSQILEEAAWISGIIKTSITDLVTINKSELIIDQRSNIFNDRRKIMGIAIALSGNKFLYHASILIDTDLKALNNSLLQKPNYPESGKRFVKSVRSPVMNLREMIPGDTENLINSLKSAILTTIGETLNIRKSFQEIYRIEDLNKFL